MKWFFSVGLGIPVGDGGNSDGDGTGSGPACFIPSPRVVFLTPFGNGGGGFSAMSDSNGAGAGSSCEVGARGSSTRCCLSVPEPIKEKA